MDLPQSAIKNLAAVSVRSGGGDTLPVSETFHSIQGEGKLTGVPSFFIRISGCNLRCGWCDTPYASWNPDGGPMAISELIGLAVASGARHTVVTGGEPMLFPHVVKLCEGLRHAGLHITIETAGTIWREVPHDLMSISPKLSNSTPQLGDPRDPGGGWRDRHEQRRINLAALQSLIDGAGEIQLKFVVATPEDLPEVERLLSKLRGWKPTDILLMPEGVTVPPPGAMDWIVRECVARSWRLCPRLHVQLFGNTRGT